MVATPKRVTAQGGRLVRAAWPYAAFLPGFEHEKLTHPLADRALSTRFGGANVELVLARNGANSRRFLTVANNFD